MAGRTNFPQTIWFPLRFMMLLNLTPDFHSP